MPKITSIHQWMSTLKQTFSFFDGFFLLASQDGVFWIWPPSLTFYPCPSELSQSKEGFTLSWDQPSFLRISHRTSMPYHGYVVPSPIHDRIYAFLQTTVPQHITVLPILTQESPMGLLYMERKTVEDLSHIPSIAKIELQWTDLATQFVQLFHLRRNEFQPRQVT